MSQKRIWSGMNAKRKKEMDGGQRGSGLSLRNTREVTKGVLSSCASFATSRFSFVCHKGEKEATSICGHELPRTCHTCSTTRLGHFVLRITGSDTTNEGGGASTNLPCANGISDPIPLSSLCTPAQPPAGLLVG